MDKIPRNLESLSTQQLMTKAFKLIAQNQRRLEKLESTIATIVRVVGKKRPPQRGQ